MLPSFYLLLSMLLSCTLIEDLGFIHAFILSLFRLQIFVILMTLIFGLYRILKSGATLISLYS